MSMWRARGLARVTASLLIGVAGILLASGSHGRRVGGAG